MTEFSDTFYLKRAGRYANPLNSNDRLPVVYGDLTDGTWGVWTLPCIDTVNDVFCFAGHPVLSVANGNTITIYENDLELNPALYVFDESNDYESEGAIATVDFATPKTGSIITARGMGKSTGATLIENIIDIVNDFLTVENDFTSAVYDSTAKAMATARFTAQAYKAAGVIDGDEAIWSILVKMMSSFFGSAYVSREGLLSLEINTNTVSQGYASIVRNSDVDLVAAKIKLENIINQCPCNYAYNYARMEFRSHTDASANADTASQGIYGVRKPKTPYQFYWCRDTTSVQAVQDIIVASLKDPIYELELNALNRKHLHVDLGDHIVYSADRLYGPDGSALLNEYWKVVGLELSENISFRLLDAGIFLTIAFLADGGLEAVIASGSVTLDNIHACYTDGSAFVRFADYDLSAYAGVRTSYKLTVTDSAGKAAVGYIAEADAAEALGGELITNGGFAANTASWTAVPAAAPATLASVAGGQDGNCLQVTENGGANPGCYQSIVTVAGKLYKVMAYVKAGTEATYNLAIRNGAGAWIIDDYQGEATGSWVEHTLYFTAIGAATRVYLYQIALAATGTTLLWDTVVLKEVTDCGIDGVHIVSAGSGSTRNWADIEAGFNYNDASGYTWEISVGRLADGSTLAGGTRDPVIY